MTTYDVKSVQDCRWAYQPDSGELTVLADDLPPRVVEMLRGGNVRVMIQVWSEKRR